MITFIGRMAENSSTKSPPPFFASASRKPAAVRRANGSSSDTARGVNTRLTSFRCVSCIGGSMKIIIGNMLFVSRYSSVVPSAEL